MDSHHTQSFKIIAKKTVCPTKGQSLTCINAMDLIWWPDLTWSEPENLNEGVKDTRKKLLKIWRLYTKPFLSQQKKPKVAVDPPSPPRREVIQLWAVFVCILNIYFVIHSSKQQNTFFWTPCKSPEYGKAQMLKHWSFLHYIPTILD